MVLGVAMAAGPLAAATALASGRDLEEALGELEAAFVTGAELVVGGGFTA